MKNPFKFGSIVEEPYFINRREEIRRVNSVLAGANHLIIISPRRFGKSSLIGRVMRESSRPALLLDLQMITTPQDFAAQLLKRTYRLFPFERMKQAVRHFRIIPGITLNPVNSEVDITFQPGAAGDVLLEDVLNLIEKLSTARRKILVVFDEFQDIRRIDPQLDRQLRAVIQYHQKLNYVFLGSQESLMREIFEQKRSPFYHFGTLLILGSIPLEEFRAYISAGLAPLHTRPGELAGRILEVSGGHPYYTQQLAFTVWDLIWRDKTIADPVDGACREIIRHYDMNYERLWNTLNRTDRKILIGMAVSSLPPLSAEFSEKYFSGATSTIFSSLKRLIQNGLVIKTDAGYQLDDPFFKRWLITRRQK